ncbi:hypothetical protein E1B28_010790 [Marasmius oreades]|uniref:F-box domain-containing protein n=1 Tax=Marasmius oreades TaxID=181124 RepID=A0A9P7RSP7_9AGAR|nr:uncharacterized protein E1B28_010790 [Marasmius oreades]KAG7089081.1 hypothetical protein E1B28_010790 [Marasmius oreades]
MSRAYRAAVLSYSHFNVQLLQGPARIPLRLGSSIEKSYSQMLPHSPFSQTFDTNYATSIQDIHRIKDILLIDPLESLRKLDEEIARLQAQREVLYTFNNHPTILSPFRRVPPEIWRLVFSCCLPGSDFPVRTITEAPLLLTRICRSWREIALTTPGLWNAIHINIARKPPRFDDVWYTKMRARICGVKRWLERSGSLPLRISLSVSFGTTVNDWNRSSRVYTVERPPGPHSSMTPEELAADLAALLLPYSSRWQTLSLNYIPPSILEMLLGDGVDLSVLQKISFEGAGLSNESALLSRLLQKARSCTILHINDHILRGLMYPASFWARLTQLNTSIPMPANHFLSALAALCPSLTTCTVQFARLPRAGTVHFYASPCKWEHLRKLDMTFLRRADMSLISDVLKVINTPFLAEFRIAWDFGPDLSANPVGEPDRVTESPIHEFLLRSECEETLTRLTVDLPRQQLELLVQTLAVLPSLKFLRIGKPDHRVVPVLSTFPPLSEHLIQALTSISICPRLEELELLNCSPNHVDALLNVASARNLRAFTVDFGQHPKSVDVLLNSGSVTESLDALRSKGMGVGWRWRALECNLDTPRSGLIS